VLYRCDFLLYVLYRCDLLLYVLYTCVLLLYVLYRCDLLLYVLYRCDLILYVLYRCDLLLYENSVPICALYERHPYTLAIGATTYSMAIATPYLYTSYRYNFSMSWIYMVIVPP